jgi:tight adherence protein B
MPSSELVPGLSNLMLLLTVATTVVVPAGLTYVIGQYVGPQARLRSRLAAIGGRGTTRADSARPQSDRARQIKTKLKETGHAEGARADRSVALRLRVDRAGLDVSLRSVYLASLLSGLAGVGLYLLLGYALLFSPAVFAVFGIGLPRAVLAHMAKRRQKGFTKHFADAIDVMVRGIRSGLPVSECLAIIARESPEPVATEFKLMIESQRLGMTPKQALERACRRMPTADMKFFAVVLNLQQQTGGNLAETLSGLSAVLRGRKKLADKIRTMSAEARMTASIIGCLPFLLSLVIYALNPNYIMLLWTDPIGNVILYSGLTWMAIGIFIMKQMVSFEV